MDPKALYQLTYGLFLLTARQDGKDNGCIINTAIQTANDPTRISIAVIKKNLTCKMIENTGIFNLSTLTVQTDFALFQRFGMQSGRDTDKFDGFPETERTENGLLRLTRNANMYLSAKVVDSKDLGSHMVFFAELTAGEVLSSVPSCTYAYYQSDIKPKPQPAKKKAWVCSVCGYVYEGDEVPDDFVCPLCSHGKQDFVRVEDPTPAKQSSAAAESKKWVCPVCGYVHEGPEAPEECPVCKVPGSKFIKQEENMVWAAEHVIGIAKDVPEEIKEGLRANFRGECTEVGMYLAMARAAHREGYPEIGLYWEKAAFEEAEHAAKFAELLGEVVSPSTKQNLTVRVEAENGATQGKTDLARKAKELGLDAIHDTVHEMARDEARHGKAFAGLLKRYFNR